MMGACRRSLVHGPLLLLRYTLGGLPWGLLLTPSRAGAGDAGSPTGPAALLQAWLDRMLDLLEQVSGAVKGGSV